jgi:hypothetical protein
MIEETFSMEPEPSWDMLLHHLEAASAYAEAGGLADLQQRIDAVKEEAKRVASRAKK